MSSLRLRDAAELHDIHKLLGAADTMQDLFDQLLPTLWWRRWPARRAAAFETAAICLGHLVARLARIRAPLATTWAVRRGPIEIMVTLHVKPRPYRAHSRDRTEVTIFIAGNPVATHLKPVDPAGLERAFTLGTTLLGLRG